jgi:8-oxo-dGTP pyrophosphatase MutT (NUDIX family)
MHARESEYRRLVQAYGAPLKISAVIDDTDFDPITKEDRDAEVCMVIRRKNGRLIAARKTYYPDGIMRLLTGGIAHGEEVETALRREVAEETSLGVVVRRFLALIEYRLSDTHTPCFTTWVFLLDERDGVLAASDPEEQIEAFAEVAICDLLPMAKQLEAIADEENATIHGNWRSWGRFRAVAHRAVAEALEQ